MANEKNTDKLKALDAVLLQIEKQYGKGSIMRLGDEAGNTEIEVIPSGCLTLDLALGSAVSRAVESSKSTALNLRVKRRWRCTRLRKRKRWAALRRSSTLNTR